MVVVSLGLAGAARRRPPRPVTAVVLVFAVAAGTLSVIEVSKPTHCWTYWLAALIPFSRGAVIVGAASLAHPFPSGAARGSHRLTTPRHVRPQRVHPMVAMAPAG